MPSEAPGIGRATLRSPALEAPDPLAHGFVDPALAPRLRDAPLADGADLDRVIADAPEEITAPSLLLLGELDRIIDNAKTRAFFDRFASREKRVIEYPGAHHTLEFEPDPEPIFDDLIAWLHLHASVD